MGCYGLLSATRPSPPPSTFPPPHIARLLHRLRPCYLDKRAEGEPPPTLPQEDYGQILATSPKVEDGLQLGVCKYSS
jgi:hypothetical protein